MSARIRRVFFKAGEGVQTLDIDIGNVTLCRLSYESVIAVRYHCCV